MVKQKRYRTKEWIIELEGILKKSGMKFKTYKVIKSKNPITGYMARYRATKRWVGTNEYLRPIKDTIEKLKITMTKPYKKD
jgi:hypothetical protein